MNEATIETLEPTHGNILRITWAFCWRWLASGFIITIPYFFLKDFFLGLPPYLEFPVPLIYNYAVFFLIIWLLVSKKRSLFINCLSPEDSSQEIGISTGKKAAIITWKLHFRWLLYMFLLLMAVTAIKMAGYTLNTSETFYFFAHIFAIQAAFMSILQNKSNKKKYLIVLQKREASSC